MWLPLVLGQVTPIERFFQNGGTASPETVKGTGAHDEPAVYNPEGKVIMKHACIRLKFHRWHLPLILLLVMGTHLAPAQGVATTRKFIQVSVDPSDPVKIEGFRVDGNVVTSGQTFQATDEAWLRDASVIVSDRSAKEVVGVWLTLYFPEIGDGKSTVVDHIQIGNVASSETHTLSGRPLHDNDNPPFSLLPGHLTAIRVGPNYENTKALRDRTRPSLIPTVCQVMLSLVYFRDGTKWSPGVFSRPDPENPGKYVVIPASEFYADMRAKQQ